MPLQQSTLALRIFGDDLIPEEVSALLGCEPTHAYRKGQVRQTPSYIAKTGSWLLEAADAEPGDLEAQIAEVLGRVTQDLHVWRQLVQKFEVDLYCGAFLRERNIDTLQAKFSEYAGKGLSRQRFWENDPDGPRMEQEDKNDRTLISKSWSPFKGYLQAQDSLLQEGDVNGSPHDAEAKAMAGLALAGYLGDTRADQFALAYVGNDPVRQAIYTALQNATTNQAMFVRATLSSGCTPISSDNIPQ